MLKAAIVTGIACAILTSSFIGCGGSTDTGLGQNPGGPGSSGGGASGYSNATLGAGGVTGPHFPGSGTSFSGAPLQPAVPADTAGECSAPPPSNRKVQVTSAKTACVYGATADPNVPAATIEAITEVVDDKNVIHIRITFDPAFVDNSYGANAIGWGSTATAEPAPPPAGGMMGMKMPKPKKGGHTFKDLVGSDHVEVKFTDKSGDVKLHVAVDYISEDPSSPCGYGNLGVTGGEGKVFIGSASSVLAVATSLDRDLNGCGYCLTTDSPATDENYTPNPDNPKWDYRVVYELWIDASTFGAAGYGEALLDFVHASPSKLAENTVTVSSRPCPPDWDIPYCKPNLQGEGLNCGSNTGGAGGAAGAGGQPNCPEGYVVDLQSESRTCTPGTGGTSGAGGGPDIR
jgi:hypothetical protein